MWLWHVVITAAALAPQQDAEANSNWRIMNQTGVELSAAGRYAEAHRVFQEALQEAAEGEAGLDIRVTVGQNLAANQMRRGNYLEAERLLRRLILELERAIGPRHPWLAMPLANLATLQMRAGRHAESRRLQEQAIECLNSDPAHLDRQLLNRMRLRVATALVFAGRLDEAEAEFRRLMAIGPVSSDRADPAHIELMNNYGLLMVRRNKVSEAAKLFNQALEERAWIWPADHPDLLPTLSNLAWCYSRMGRHAEAAALEQRALAICERSGETQTWQCGCLRVQYSEALRKMNRKDEAKAFAERGEAMMAQARRELPGRHTVDIRELAALARR
jgi:tetratricopeptide (TPR) repeat protein